MAPSKVTLNFNRSKFPILFLKAAIASLAMITLVILYQQRSFLRVSQILDTEIEETKLCPPEGKYDQLDPCLVSYVKCNLLLRPSGLPLNLPKKTTHDKYPGIHEKIAFLDKHLIRKGQLSSPQGFFIECGANNGEFISNTLLLERRFNWTGLLIEPNPDPFKEMVALHRNAWMINQGLCTTNYSDKVQFFVNTGDSGPGAFSKNYHQDIEFEVTCVPLYTILLALNVSVVDYLSLDVQGVELDIMKTLPLDKVVFKVMTLEHDMLPGFQKALINFLEKHNYKFVGSVLDGYTRDSLFVHESVYTKDMKTKVKYHAGG